MLRARADWTRNMTFANFYRRDTKCKNMKGAPTTLTQMLSSCSPTKHKKDALTT